MLLKSSLLPRLSIISITPYKKQAQNEKSLNIMIYYAESYGKIDIYDLEDKEMIEKRKDFIINCLYLAIIGLISFVIIKFTFDHLMPFVVGFMIAFILKPIVRKLDEVFGHNKWVGVIVAILFYTLVLVLITWAIFGSIALIQQTIPSAENFMNTTLIPMANEVIAWFEEALSNLDPRMTTLVDRGITEFMNALERILDFISSSALSWITVVVSSTPKILIAIILSVISSFFFSMDYELIVGNLLSLIPEKVRKLILSIKNDFTGLIAKYLLAYGKLMSLTFIELAIGFTILRVKGPISLAAIVSIVDILPVLGTGTVLLPWAFYEIIVGSAGFGFGLLILYGIISTIRYILEPRVVGKQIGLHPLLTLVSIFIGVKFMGFWGLFIFPILVTILVTMHKENQLNIKAFFVGEKELIEDPKPITQIDEGKNESPQ